jgi:hypothetical protein
MTNYTADILLRKAVIVAGLGLHSQSLGVLLIIGESSGDLIDSLANLLFPNFALIAYPGLAVGTIGELALLFWFLVTGGKTY